MTSARLVLIVEFVSQPMLQPGPDLNPLWDNFLNAEEPDFRSVGAFDFVLAQFRDVARKFGARDARIERSVLVERATTNGINRHDVEVALRILLVLEHLDARGEVLQLPIGREQLPLASEQGTNRQGRSARSRPLLAKLHPIVQDVVQRRADGRSLASEPLGAFAERLAVLGYAPFRMWWQQTVAELRLLDAATTPVASAVLAASLVEGALTFVVRHAHTLGLGVLGSKTFDEPPQRWKIEDLVSSACAGGASAILDAGARHSADALIRQRIHAGRMLSEYPGGVPDLRPEEARDARSTVDLVVRRILDWLDRYPATTGP